MIPGRTALLHEGHPGETRMKVLVDGDLENAVKLRGSFRLLPGNGYMLILREGQMFLVVIEDCGDVHSHIFHDHIWAIAADFV